jgi:hypothetical protein
MAISMQVNRHVFTTRVFDSGALTVLASVIHQFAEPGKYIVSIRRGDAVLGSTRFEVAVDAPMQLNIDLAAGGIPGKANPFDRSARAAKAGASASAKDCGCGGGGAAHAASAQAVPAGAPPPKIVSPQGYVQFHVSHGEGRLSAQVRKEQTDKVLFDTTLLGKGDLFAVSLLAPATFTLANIAGTAAGTVTVTFSKDVAARIKQTPPVFADVSKSAFTPKDLQISSGQGLVFRVQDAARIVVTQKTDPEPKVSDAARPASRRIYRVPPVKPR